LNDKFYVYTQVEKKYWEVHQGRAIHKRLSNHPVTKFFSKQRFDYIGTKIDTTLIKKSLDVGCGSGFSSSNSPFDVIGLDFSLLNLKIIKKIKPDAELIQASAYNLPFKENSFDMVYSWECLHHLEYPQISVNEMMYVTNKFLILIEPNRTNLGVFLYAIKEKIERKMLKYCKSKLLSFIDDNFSIVECEVVGMIFAGSTPLFLLSFFKKLPFKSPFGMSCILIAIKNKDR